MADLTIDLTDAGLNAAALDYTLETVDALGRPFAPTVSGHLVVRKLTGRTAADGTATASLTATADWDQANIYWRFSTEGYSRIFTKTGSTEALVDTTAVTTAPASPSPFELGDLSDVNLTGLADTNSLVYDVATDTWGPGSGGGGSGDVVGPASATDSQLAAFDGTTGKLLKDAGAPLSSLLTTAAAAAGYQPLDSDLTAIAALSTTSYGRALLALADQAALTALVAAATTTLPGAVELATTAEVQTGTDTTRAVTAAGTAAAISGTSPWLVDLGQLAPGKQVSSVGSWTFSFSASLYGGGYYRTVGGTTADEIIWKVALGAGTWELNTYYTRFTDAAILTVSLGGSTVGTVDTYGTLANNVLSTFSGIAVSVPGVFNLRYQTLTKNASSSGYGVYLQTIFLRRTA